MYKQIEFEVKGVSALLLHNGRLADPANPIVIEMKKFSSKRKKTESDYAAMAELEWKGSLYLENGRVVLPGEMLEAAIINGAKKKRQGTNAKIAVFVENNALLQYAGSENIEELWEDENFRLTIGVVIRGSRVMRTRPRFKEWNTKIIVSYNDEIVDNDNVIDWVVTAGQQCGLGDWRPKFGRFEVVNYKEL